jgi:hypothetical protein
MGVVKTIRIYGAHRACRRASLAVLSLLLSLLAAGLPGLPDPVRVALVALGYGSFVLLLRSALLCWRRDWEGLWRADLDRRPVSPVARFPGSGIEGPQPLSNVVLFRVE